MSGPSKKFMRQVYPDQVVLLCIDRLKDIRYKLLAEEWPIKKIRVELESVARDLKKIEGR